jgi:probable rRNA maturation factor
MIYLQISETITSIQDDKPINKQALILAAHSALELADRAGEFDLTVLLSDDDQVQRLNRQFRDVDATTDVLAFLAGDTDPDSQSVYLGDIIISFQQAARQAAAGGHPLEDELQLLVVHGVLHLLGYDHTDAEERAEMWALQADVLAQLNNPIRPDEI